jgi:transcriptional regulator with XRE-family HTH domain
MSINRIKVVLAENGKKNKWLAQELGKSESTISNWCTNESQPSLETLIHIANVINVDVRELINSTKSDE